jgi:hypothetical protein
MSAIRLRPIPARAITRAAERRSARGIADDRSVRRRAKGSERDQADLLDHVDDHHSDLSLSTIVDPGDSEMLPATCTSPRTIVLAGLALLCAAIAVLAVRRSSGVANGRQF